MGDSEEIFGVKGLGIEIRRLPMTNPFTHKVQIVFRDILYNEDLDCVTILFEESVLQSVEQNKEELYQSVMEAVGVYKKGLIEAFGV